LDLHFCLAFELLGFAVKFNEERDLGPQDLWNDRGGNVINGTQ
jgi:hypothetical protein